MTEPGVGGHGGYDFGRQSLFDRFSLSLLALGTLYAAWLAVRRPEWLLVLATIGVSFLAGTVLTIPPPAFHRMLGFTALSRLRYFAAAAAPERYQVELALANYVGRAFPGRPLYVAAFATHSFEKIHYFAQDKRATRVHSEFHDHQLRDLDPTEKYAYVMTLPESFVN